MSLDADTTERRRGPEVCAACARPLSDTLYFCRDCWWVIPGKDRAAMTAMHLKRENLDSKIAKCVRLIKAKRPETAAAV